METDPTRQEKGKMAVAPDEDLEPPDHLDVSKVMREKNAFFVHMIQVTDNLNVSDNNKSINTRKLSVADKLDLVYGASPTLSASTLRPETKDGTFPGGFGVIFSHGEVEHAYHNDAATNAVSLTKRKVISPLRSKEDVDRAIDEPASYNELVLKSPEVAGGFMKIASYKDRVSYHNDEESTYYDGEKSITKIGVLDMANKIDHQGRLKGSNYDRSFSVIQELERRGKTFLMDENNQMYIVRSIDPITRKVEFVADPVTPRDFAFYYGKEKMNKYHKKEIRDRLEKSLQEKGMELH